MAVALGIGALAIGGVQGRNMGIIAFMAAVAFLASLGGKTDDAQPENGDDGHQ
jgi:hypothetical protein